MCVMKFITIVIYSLVILHNINSLEIGSECRTPNYEKAICKRVHDCPTILNVQKNGKIDAKQLEFIKKSQCGYDEDYLVCCGTKDNYYAPKPIDTFSKITCGFQETDNIYGGVNTEMSEFPWLALLQYKYTDRLEYSCGGTLISSRYVLTAAHCILNQLATLTMVRLGEWNLNKTKDCIKVNNRDFCNEDPLDVEIESTVVHGRFDILSENRRHDIGLIRLMKTVKFSNFVRPICLPPHNEDAKPGEIATVAGWGKTENHDQSELKKKVNLPIFNFSSCAEKFEKYGVELGDDQLCAGGESNKDTCIGDSGGPLMKTLRNDSSQWYIEGIVSFGRACGKKGWPGVYTKVSFYLDWIYANTQH